MNLQDLPKLRWKTHLIRTEHEGYELTVRAEGDNYIWFVLDIETRQNIQQGSERTSLEAQLAAEHCCKNVTNIDKTRAAFDKIVSQNFGRATTKTVKKMNATKFLNLSPEAIITAWQLRHEGTFVVVDELGQAIPEEILEGMIEEEMETVHNRPNWKETI